MAHFDMGQSGRGAWGRAFGRIFDTPLDRATRAKARRIAALRALSDAELAAQGIRRDQILTHVFLGGG